MLSAFFMPFIPDIFCSKNNNSIISYARGLIDLYKKDQQ
ncbi:Hypothetical protein AKI40_3069 [Enterobacter sp. FY-07]|nr:Hypothetical protein AKI40_3069 [Enterobacter sp. FY-07]